MSDLETYLLWENAHFVINTPANPNIPYTEGVHIYVAPKNMLSAAWDNPVLAGKTFQLASEACRIMKDLELAPWFNLQSNGDWGHLPGRSLYFHVHIFGRNKTESWAKPITLPKAPGTYSNEPMPEKDRSLLIEAFKSLQS
jgi:diadenosine tetraphosphate (Ap4A) HIT family hydrolase